MKYVMFMRILDSNGFEIFHIVDVYCMLRCKNQKYYTKVQQFNVKDTYEIALQRLYLQF